MLKNSLIYLLATIFVVFFSYLFPYTLHAINQLYSYLYALIIPFFSVDHRGSSLVKIILLVIIPVAIAAIPALLYRLIRKREMPYFLSTVWIVWLIVVFSNLLVGHR